jgi:hypothetical protein
MEYILWQDYVFAVGSFIFSIALIPAIISKDKPPISTSLTTGIILAVFIFCYASLGLWLSACSGSLTAIAWFILFFQKIYQNKKLKQKKSVYQFIKNSYHPISKIEDRAAFIHALKTKNGGKGRYGLS